MTPAPPETNSTFEQALRRWQRVGLVVGVAALALAGVAAIWWPAAFFRGYLFAFFFWLGLPLGSAGFLFIHHLTGGAWGLAIRRPTEATLPTLPLLAVLVIPVLVGIGWIYPWAHASVLAEHPHLELKTAYLNPPFFIARSVLYLALWVGGGLLLYAWSLRQDRQPSAALARRLTGFSAGGLVALVLSVTFASVDWIMSLEPLWYSTIFGFYVVAGQGLLALALATLVMAGLSLKPVGRDLVSPDQLNDLGNLLLTTVILYTYLALSQFILIWSGNLPHEVVWYVARTRGLWRWVPPVLVVVHFAIPFFFLLIRQAKRRATVLMSIAAILLVARVLDLVWTVVPALGPSSAALAGMIVAAWIGIGGLWLAVYARGMAVGPLVPQPLMSAEAVGV